MAAQCDAIRSATHTDERCPKQANCMVNKQYFCGLHKSGKVPLFSTSKSITNSSQLVTTTNTSSTSGSGKSASKSKASSSKKSQTKSKSLSVKKTEELDATITTNKKVSSVKKDPEIKSKKTSSVKKDSDVLKGKTTSIISVIETEFADKGGRKYMEDYTAIFDINSVSQHIPGPCKLYIICDGHGGYKAAKWIIDNFVGILCVNIKTNPTMSIPDICRKSTLDNSNGWNKYSEENNDLEDGSTFLWALLHLGSATLWVNNVGDSRAIACKNGKALFSTTDHKPTDPAELKRLKKRSVEMSKKSNGKNKIEITKRDGDEARVNKILCMTRSVGDRYKSMPEGTLDRRADLFDIDTSKGVDLVMATDGLWDVVSNAECARQIASRPDYVAKDLVEYAKTKPNLSDNVSAIIVRISPIVSK